MPIVVPADFPESLETVNGNMMAIWFNRTAPALDVRMQTWIAGFFGEVAPSGTQPLPSVYAFLPKTIMISDRLTPTLIGQDWSGIYRASEVVAEAITAAIYATNYALNPGNLLAAYNNAWT